MRVLIVESDPNLGWIWKRHVERFSAEVTLVQSQEAAVTHIEREEIDIVVLDLILGGGSAIAVADYCAYRRPDAKIIFVTNTSFFSDGSIFAHSPNACAYIQSETPPEDLAAMIEHYAALR